MKLIYKARNLVEQFIGLAKHFRGVATRYKKTHVTSYHSGTSQQS